MNKIVAAALALAVLGSVVFFTTRSGHKSTLRPKRGVVSQDVSDLFEAWKVKHNKTYGGVESSYRLSVFADTVERVNKINSVKRAYTVGLNKFADLTKEEFKSIYLGLKKKTAVRLPTNEPLAKVAAAGAVDWRNQNAVTPVKNQGQCGSCWAFSTTGSLEGLNAIKNGNLLSFSEQQLVDCAGDYGNEGCDGGDMSAALQYVAATGITLEASYPYTAEDGTCQTFTVAFQNNNYGTANSQADLLAAVTNQPVSVSVEADQDVFQLYTGGVLTADSDCGTNLDHGVLAVGYDTADGVNYWIVKNSWGADWGLDGYLQIERTTGDGVCGINMDNSYPTL